MKGTTIETIQSQTQARELYTDLSNRVNGSKKRQAIAVFDLMACAALATVCTQSVLHQPQPVDDLDEDMSDPRHVNMSQKREAEDYEQTRRPVDRLKESKRRRKVVHMRLR